MPQPRRVSEERFRFGGKLDGHGVVQVAAGWKSALSEDRG
jgi:hypothetical protein